VCLYVCMYVCMYVYIYMCIYTHTHTPSPTDPRCLFSVNWLRHRIWAQGRDKHPCPSSELGLAACDTRSSRAEKAAEENTI